MSTPRIVIVGGVAGGASAATRARRMNEQAEIVIFEKGAEVSFANCGLPYYIGGQIRQRGRLLLATPEYFRQTFGIQVFTRHEVTRIDRAGHAVEVVDLETGRSRQERYDKLILAPGAAPVLPPWTGADSLNVFVLRDVPDSDRIKAWIDQRGPRRAVIVGAGYIGLEMAEVLRGRGLEVSLVEQASRVMPLFDEVMSREIRRVLEASGVAVHCGVGVEGLSCRDGLVEGVRLADGTLLEADMVVVAAGVRPMTRLAAEAGLTIGAGGAIAVDAHGRTSDPDIYAVGDAAEVVHAVLGRPMRVPLAGPANRNGRLAGQHAATGSSRPATPVLGTSVVGFFGHAAGMTGLSLEAARAAGRDASCSFAIRGHHVGYYPGAENMVLMLVYERGTRKVLGAQAVGGAGVDKRIDVIATAMHLGGTIDDLAGLDLAYAPQFGAAKDPVHIAAFGAQNQEDGLIEQLLPGDPRIAGQLVDVRTPAEHAAGTLPGAVNIPLACVRERLGELDRSRPVCVFCGVGQRSYNAARILSQHGFRTVYNLAGGYTLHRPG